MKPNHPLYFIFIVLSLLGACGELKSVTPQTEKLLEFAKTPEWETQDLNQYEVDEFTVIVFKKGITQETWKEIFLKTKNLSRLRLEQKELTRRIHAGEDLEEKRDEVTLEITDILTDISDHYASYMLNWGGTEKCKFTKSVKLLLECRSLPTHSPTLASWSKTMPVIKEDLWVFPWIESELKSENGDWNIKLKLKPQIKTTDSEWVWTGEALARGKFSTLHDPYGYVEMRLVKK